MSGVPMERSLFFISSTNEVFLRNTLSYAKWINYIKIKI
jgi:hypothetical protein